MQTLGAALWRFVLTWLICAHTHTHKKLESSLKVTAVVYCAAVVVQLNLDFPSLGLMTLFESHMMLKPPVYQNSPQEYGNSPSTASSSSAGAGNHISAPKSCRAAGGEPLRVCSHSDRLPSHKIESR